MSQSEPDEPASESDLEDLLSQIEPAPAQAPRGTNVATNGRWRWYYSNICDYRLAHPGCTNREIAAYLNKNENTVGGIIKSDLYQSYEQKRRTIFRMRQEEQLRSRLTGVTLKALDSMEAQLDKRKDQVPLQLSTEIVSMGLDRLGFAPATTPSVVVNNQVVAAPAVSPTVLEEARMALRAVERSRLAPPQKEVEQLEALAEPVDVEVDGTPADVSQPDAGVRPPIP